MNRLEFIKASIAIVGISQMQPKKSMSTDPHLLIGKGNPRLVGKNYALLPEVHKAFQQMSASALKLGIKIKVVSSYRSFEKQKNIWNNKFTRFTSKGMNDKAAINKIIEYSTLPGTSRHHWGTDIDIIDAGPPEEGDVLLPHKFHNNGPYNNLREWMETHSKDYGFHLPYSRVKNRTGFKYEPWHFSYAPRSIPMLNQYLNLDHGKLILSSDLCGAELIDHVFLESYIKTHVMGIDPSLLKFI